MMAFRRFPISFTVSFHKKSCVFKLKVNGQNVLLVLVVSFQIALPILYPLQGLITQILLTIWIFRQHQRRTALKWN